MKSRFVYSILEPMIVNYRLVAAMGICVIGLALLQSYTSSPTLDIIGFAESQEMTLSYDSPVKVKKVFVVPGQRLNKGQPILEVEQPDVALKMAQTQSQLEILKSKYLLQAQLTRTLQNSSLPGRDPLLDEIRGLQRQVQQLQHQQDLSLRYASEEAVIGSVHFRQNDQVAPFQPIITYSRKAPNFVYGYVHENRFAELHIGDNVSVSAIAPPLRFIDGHIISLGTRITEFPLRLQVIPGRSTWGREVVIAIPENNDFLMGEKLMVRPNSHDKGLEIKLNQALASSDSTINEVTMTGVSEGIYLEPSGLYYDGKTDELLMASDDSGPNGSPFWVNQLNSKSSARGPVNLRWEAPVDINDIESMASDGHYFYAMGSLGKNKKGELPSNRQKLIRFTVVNGQVRVDRELNLRTQFIQFLSGSPVSGQVDEKIDDLEVEGMTIYRGDAYIALKAPLVNDGFSVILRYPSFVGAIDSGQVESSQLSIYQIRKLHDVKNCKHPSRITDLVMDDRGLLLLSVCKKKENYSQIWRLKNEPSQQQQELLASIPNGRFEGISFSDHSNVVLLSSDPADGQPADIIKVQLPLGQ